jgi:uncharacterized protein (UPF0332 family)
MHFAEILRWEQDDRMLADYDVAFEPQIELVIQRVEDARIFFEMAGSFLQSYPSK